MIREVMKEVWSQIGEDGEMGSEGKIEGYGFVTQ